VYWSWEAKDIGEVLLLSLKLLQDWWSWGFRLVFHLKKRNMI